MTTTVRILLAAATALLALAAPALARRPTTDAEVTSMLTSGVSLGDGDCPETTVSTVDESWGALRSQCGGGSTNIVRRAADGRWSDVASGDGREACVDAFPLVPEPVAADLTGCGRSTLRRSATEEERRAVAADVLRGLDPRCVALRVSLVDERFAGFTLPDSDACRSGAYVVSRASGRWKTVAEVHGDRFLCRTAGVPEAVMRSLAPDCAVPRPPAIACAAGGEAVRRVRPRTCDTSGSHASLATSRWLVGLRWSSWGGRKAVGRGYSRHYRSRASDRHLPVRVELSGLSEKGCGAVQPLYTRLRIVYKRSRITVGGTPFRIPAGATTVKLGRPTVC